MAGSSSSRSSTRAGRPGGSGSGGGGTRRRRPAPNQSQRRRPDSAPPPPVVLPPRPDPWGPAATRNVRRAFVSTFLPAAVVAVVLLALIAAGLPVLVCVVLAVAVMLVPLAVWKFAPGAVARRVDSVAASEVDYARLHNVAEVLCLASGLPKPALRVIADPAPNAVSFGRSAADASLVFTTGLLHLLDRMELEAVVAHELAHVRGRDTFSGAVSAFTAARISPRLAVRAAGVGRESLADQAAASMTRYPPGLVSALGKIAGAPGSRPVSLSASAVRTTGHLWLVPLQPPPAGAKPLAGHLDPDERIAVLLEL